MKDSNNLRVFPVISFFIGAAVVVFSQHVDSPPAAGGRKRRRRGGVVIPLNGGGGFTWAQYQIHIQCIRVTIELEAPFGLDPYCVSLIKAALQDAFRKLHFNDSQKSFSILFFFSFSVI